MSMSPLRRALMVVAVVLAVLALGFIIGWFGTRPGAPAVPPQPPVASEPTDSESGATNRSPFFKKRAEPRTPEVETSVVSTNVTMAATNGMANWEDKIDEILVADTEVSDKAKKLLELFPKFPETGQIEAAQHLSNLLDDDDYAPMGRYLTNMNMSASVLDVLMNDALNRPNSMKLPLFLEVARNPDHPKASEAKDDLEFYLEEDYGTNWMMWEEKLQAWLKENPD
jgi:hypothetical protein